MNLMRFAEQEGKDDPEYCVAWLPEGKSFVIRNPDEFSRHLVPKFFKQTKFSSFTRKLYRWGFRQINRGIGPDDPIIFGNEFFDRDNEASMSKMRSVTAAGTRKAEQNRSSLNFLKRPHEGMYDMMGSDPKRMFLDQYMHQKANLMHQNASLYGGMSTNGGIPMAGYHMRQGAMGMDGHPGMHHPQGPPMMMGHPPHGMGGGAGGPKPSYDAVMHHNAQYQHMQHMQNSHMMGAPQMYMPQQHSGQQSMGMGSGHSPSGMTGSSQQAGEAGMHTVSSMSGMQGMGNMQNGGMQSMQQNMQGMQQGMSGMQDNGMMQGGGAGQHQESMNNGPSHHQQQQPHQTSSSNSNITPTNSGSQQRSGNQGTNSGGSQQSGGGYPNPQSTADIVNAAIAALRYSH